jgi:Holliday junction resolvase RusA-like endonuclease
MYSLNNLLVISPKTKFFSIILSGRIPSKKNSKRIIQRGRKKFLVPSEQHQLWQFQTMLQLRPLVAGMQGLLPLAKVGRIFAIFYMPDNRAADLSNKFESVADLLVDAGVLKDDRWQVTPTITLHCEGVDKGNPRVELTFMY